MNNRINRLAAAILIGLACLASPTTMASQLPTRFHVPRGTRGQHTTPPREFDYGTLTPSGLPFQDTSSPHPSLPGLSCQPPVPPHNPTPASNTICSTAVVWALPLSLAATPGISLDFSSSGY